MNQKRLKNTALGKRYQRLIMVGGKRKVEICQCGCMLVRAMKEKKAEKEFVSNNTLIFDQFVYYRKHEVTKLTIIRWSEAG